MPLLRVRGRIQASKDMEFRFYNVKMFKWSKRRGLFNHYFGVSPRGKGVKFVIRIGYRKQFLVLGTGVKINAYEDVFIEYRRGWEYEDSLCNFT